tara:strand:- start:1073 stop:1198 length:126 start_codon:yes stop_codon:yes gene_type:complete
MKEYITKTPNLDYSYDNNVENFISINIENEKYNKLLQELFH